MKYLKKTLSVFLALVMLMAVSSVGFYGLAAEIDYNTQYNALAAAMKNDYVRELTNYNITNNRLEDENEGFSTDANGFMYEHKVTAADDASGSILKAANRFYYIAETLISTTYGTGCYNGEKLVAAVAAKLRPYFESEETIYEDFYGNRYYPTEEQIADYNEAVAAIEAAERKVNEATLTQLDIYFIEKDVFEYYNVESILQYFVGNVLTLNAGNWYHKFVFVVETSISTCIVESGGIQNSADSYFTVREAAYEFSYKRTYNETQTKAYYSFKMPSLEQVVEDYGSEYGFTMTPADLTTGITRNGQAANIAISVSYDMTTIPYLLSIYNTFLPYVGADYSEEAGTWDSQFINYTDDYVASWVTARNVVNYISDITSQFSNEALLAMFADEIGNMITMAYILTSNKVMPTRTVRGTATYDVTTDKLDEIVSDFDALVTPNDNDESQIASRVATVVSLFFNTSSSIFEGTSVEGIEFSSLNDLVGKLLNALVFRDSIITYLVKLLYPMVVNALTDLTSSVSALSGLIDDIISNNSLAIYPNSLADRLSSSEYGGKYTVAAAILRNAGTNWDNVNYDALTWGVDDADLGQKMNAFSDALCAALSGFMRLLVTIMCGDDECASSSYGDKDSRYSDNFDRNIVQAGLATLYSQGAYTKLIIPLFRVLGVSQGDGVNGYASTTLYHSLVASDYNNAIKTIVDPLLRWVTNELGARPFETILTLLPNLVNFFSRTSTVSMPTSNWEDGKHNNFTSAQTHNIWEIMGSIYINVSTVFGISAYCKPLASLLSKYEGMLSSINNLLNSVLKLEYETENVMGLDTCAYSNAAGEVVLPDSAEYGMNPESYPNACVLVYTNEKQTSFSLAQDEEHPNEYTKPIYETVPYKIPAIQEQKLIDCGTVKNPTIENTLAVEHPGTVLLYLLRYVFSALGYKYDSHIENLPALIECFGIDPAKELFQGFSFGDIIYNVMLHPDEAICAILELFYTNETGDYYASQPYTYPLKNVNYYSTTLLNKNVNPGLCYGTQVRYTKYWTQEYANDVVNNIGPLVENVLAMLGFTQFSGGIGNYLRSMLLDKVFADELVNKLFNTVYQLLAGLSDTVGFDLANLLEAVLDVSYSPATIAACLRKMLGYETEASRAIAAVSSWEELFVVKTYDPDTNELLSSETHDVAYDWGLTAVDAHGISQEDAFLRVLSSLLSPVSFVFEYLLLDKDFDILGLIKLPGYAGYQYSFIALLEALSCPNILTYSEYYTYAQDNVTGSANVIYYLFTPILGLLEELYADPINTLLGMLPNFLFFVSIGGLNDVLNNFVHFAYVLLDILKPVVNGYDLLNGLISNIEVAGVSINLSLPLDLDFNGLVSDLLGTLVGDSLTIKGVSLTLPYIDFHTLCCGTLQKYTSKELRMTVQLSSSGGGDILTALLRLVFEVVFMEENKQAVVTIISNQMGEGLDDYDNETIYLVLDKLYSLAETYDLPDMLLFVVYQLVTKVTPLSGTIAEKFTAAGMTVQEFVSSMSSYDTFTESLHKLLGESEPSEDISNIKAASSLIEKLRAFFEKIKLFFMQFFKIGG